MAFDPRSISGCMCWYNPNQASSLTMSGTGVQAIADLSGNGRTATALGTPLPTISNLGGLNALKFVRAVSTTPLATGTFTQAQPVTGFCVLKQDALGSPSDFFSFIGSNVSALGPNFSNDLQHYSLGDWVGGFDGPDQDLLPHVWSYVFNGASSSMWQDGNLYAAGDAGPNGWASSNITLAGNVNDGGFGGFTGQLGEVFWYNSILSTANRAAMEQYLLTNWLYDGFHGFETGSGISVGSPSGFS